MKTVKIDISRIDIDHVRDRDNTENKYEYPKYNVCIFRPDGKADFDLRLFKRDNRYFVNFKAIGSPIENDWEGVHWIFNSKDHPWLLQIQLNTVRYGKYE